MATASNGELEIGYSLAGSGPGLVLIHGTGGNGTTTWDAISGQLAADRAALAPDLRGCGASDAGELGPVSLADLAGDVEAAIRAVGWERFDLIGFSLGAAVAARLAAERPAAVSSLLMVAPSPPVADARSKLQFELWADLFEHDPQLLARLWLLTGFSSPFVSGIPVEQVNRAARFPTEAATAQQSRLCADLDLREIAGEIRCPTMVVGCSEDAVHPPEGARALASLLAQSEYSELRSGHLVMLEDPEALLGAVRGFLDDHGLPVSAPTNTGANG